MEKIEFRNLKANEIQVRPTDTKFKGKAVLLLYQNARVGMDILDDSVGPMNWSKEYYEVAGNVYCKVGIKDPETGEWTYKADCGTESNVDAEKGQASDAFKRAVVNWGIGRELYNTPKVKINCPDTYYYNDKMTMTFSVKDIDWDSNKNCTCLTIVDRFGNEVYNYSKEVKQDDEVKPVPNQSRDEYKSNCNLLKEWCSNKKQEEGIDKGELLRFYQFYQERCCKWPNRVRPELLWEKWQTTKYN